MGDEFNINDQRRAAREGWAIFQSSEHGYQIQRDDERGFFDSDKDAILFVTDMAFEFRSAYHRCAIEFLMDHGGAESE